MSVPSSHYFIYTEHNSYLTENQLSSACSVVPIIKAWKRGVRVIELDIWPNSTKDDKEDPDNSCGTDYMIEIDQRACFCCFSISCHNTPGRPSQIRSLGQRSSDARADKIPLARGLEVSHLKFNKTFKRSYNVKSNHNLDDEDNDNCDKRLKASEPLVHERLIAIRARKSKGGLKERCVVFDALVRCARLARLWDLYAITSCPFRFYYTNPAMRLLNKYFGLLVMVSCNASASSIEDGSFTLSNEWWKISAVNSTYTMCPTYPFALLVPKCIRKQSCSHTVIPTSSWSHDEYEEVMLCSS
ncbi:hypothetical protein RHMOL_Rhmol01G0209900 [Rhododendron molle]|uniref:Uncharacterized protein n=1 Tax=Rhododendron molle TaxID=49168 RepID=A0ACC0Q3E8_RHOML|nr:hypothetical protein RHMOL_Rhmol01G0209900 [Rhododendron molle]